MATTIKFNPIQGGGQVVIPEKDFLTAIRYGGINYNDDLITIQSVGYRMSTMEIVGGGVPSTNPCVTVGVGGDYAELNLAIADGKNCIKIISDVTETAPSLITVAGGYNIQFTGDYTLDFNTQNIVISIADVIVNVTGGNVTYGNAVGKALIDKGVQLNVEVMLSNVNSVCTSTGGGTPIVANCDLFININGSSITLPNQAKCYSNDNTAVILEHVLIIGGGIACQDVIFNTNDDGMDYVSNCFFQGTFVKTVGNYAFTIRGNMSNCISQATLFADDARMKLLGTMSGCRFEGDKNFHVDVVKSINVSKWNEITNCTGIKDLNLNNSISGFYSDITCENLIMADPLSIDNHFVNVLVEQINGDTTVSGNFNSFTDCIFLFNNLVIDADDVSIIGGRIGDTPGGNSNTIVVNAGKKRCVISNVKTDGQISDSGTDTIRESSQLDLMPVGNIAVTIAAFYKFITQTSFVYHGSTGILINAVAKVGTVDSGANQPTVDVTINGVSALTGPITIIGVDAEVAGVIDTSANTITNGDIIELKVIKGSSGDAQNLHVSLQIAINNTY